MKYGVGVGWIQLSVALSPESSIVLYPEKNVEFCKLQLFQASADEDYKYPISFIEQFKPVFYLRAETDPVSGTLLF
jgi:hypothetical protein